MKSFNPEAELAALDVRIDEMTSDAYNALTSWRDGDPRIYVDRRLTQGGRRSTLAHELVHIERGPGGLDAHGIPAEERIVDDLSARRLIDFDDLVDAFRWASCWWEATEELGVDHAALVSRLAGLTQSELAELAEASRGFPWPGKSLKGGPPKLRKGYRFRPTHWRHGTEDLEIPPN